MMIEELMLEPQRLEEKEPGLGSLELEYCGEYDGPVGRFQITVVKPKDEYGGGVCFPLYYEPVNPQQKRWFGESAYSEVDFKLIDPEKRKTIYEFIKMGLPAILAVKATYDGMNMDEVREKVPVKKAKIVGLGAEFSGRGKTMLATIISHLRPNIAVVSGEVFSDNDVEKYSKAIEGMDNDPRFFDFDRAVEQMKEVAKEDNGKDGGTVKMVVDRIWDAWFKNKVHEIILVDLPGRSEEADYPANSFGLLRFSMPTFDLERYLWGESDQASSKVDIKWEVLSDYWVKFNKEMGRLLREVNFFEDIFNASVEMEWPHPVPIKISK